MNFKKLKMINNMDYDINLENFVIPKNDSVIIYDIDDKNTYYLSMYLCKKYFDTIKYYVLDKKMSLIMNDTIVMNREEHFLLLWDNIKDMFVNHTIGYINDHKFYFDLAKEVFCVKNIITGKTYYVKMEKEN